MQIQPNNQKMIISEHKRTSYDKDGAVNKVDILRCIRRKDAAPSFLPQLSNEKESEQQTKTGQQKFKEVVQYLLIGTIIFCSVLLIMSFCGISLQLTDSVSISQQKIVQNNNNKIAFSKTNCTERNCEQEFNDQFDFGRNQSVLSQFYQNLLNQLQQDKDDNSSQKDTTNIKLSEMRKVIKIEDEKKWRNFLSTFAENLNCRIEGNKIICEHELNL